MYVVADGATRWGSTYKMIARQEQAVVAEDRKIMPSNIEVPLEALFPVLEQLSYALSEGKCVTPSAMYLSVSQPHHRQPP